MAYFSMKNMFDINMLHTNTYFGIIVVPSNAKPQMIYKIKRVKRLPARSKRIITIIPAGNSIPKKYLYFIKVAYSQFLFHFM